MPANKLKRIVGDEFFSQFEHDLEKLIESGPKTWDMLFSVYEDMEHHQQYNFLLKKKCAAHGGSYDDIVRLSSPFRYLIRLMLNGILEKNDIRNAILDSTDHSNVDAFCDELASKFDSCRDKLKVANAVGMAFNHDISLLEDIRVDTGVRSVVVDSSTVKKPIITISLDEVVFNCTKGDVHILIDILKNACKVIEDEYEKN